MIINFLKTDGFEFDVKTDKEKNVISNNNIYFESDQKNFTVRQKSIRSSYGAAYLFVYFLKMFFSSIIRAFIFLRKKISEEASPIFIEAEFEVIKQYSETSLFFEKSNYSPYKNLFTKPVFSFDSSLRLKKVTYFVDLPTVILNKRKQFLRKLSNFSMLTVLNTVFLIYSILEELYNVTAFSLFLFIPIIIGAIISFIKASKKYKTYRRVLDTEVNYLNNHSNDRGSDAGVAV